MDYEDSETGKAKLESARLVSGKNSDRFQVAH